MKHIPIDPSGVTFTRGLHEGARATLKHEGEQLNAVLKAHKSDPEFAAWNGRDWMFFRRGWWRGRVANAANDLMRATKYMDEHELEGLANDMRALSKKYLGYEGLTLDGELVGAEDDAS